jgi:hypothetical protein
VNCRNRATGLPFDRAGHCDVATIREGLNCAGTGVVPAVPRLRLTKAWRCAGNSAMGRKGAACARRIGRDETGTPTHFNDRLSRLDRMGGSRRGLDRRPSGLAPPGGFFCIAACRLPWFLTPALLGTATRSCANPSSTLRRS